MKNINNQIISFMVILGLFILLLSGCPGGEQPKNAANSAPNTTANSAASNTTNSAASNTTNTAISNTNSTSAASNSTTASAGTCGETPGDDEVYIYENIFSHDKGGKCVKLGVGEYKDAAAMGLADNLMSSIRVGKNVHAVVCDDENFGGTCMAFDKDDDDFMNNVTLKNDAASSVKVVKAELCSPEGGKAVTLKWTNKTDKNLRIVWVGYDCKERNEAREVERKIKPGDVMEEESFVGHIFHVTDFDTKESYGHIYVTESNATQDIKDIK